MVAPDIIKKIPKVELHDHLSGGLRIGTIIELAHICGCNLPETDPDLLATWFHKGAHQKNLISYLDTFRITMGVLQTRESLERAALEAMLDYADEHIVYAEIRFSPIHHTAKGLSLSEVIESVLKGLNEGKEKTGIYFGLILCGMRDMDSDVSFKIAQLAVAYRENGVVGFDIAGKEQGNPAKKHIKAFQYIRQHHLHSTIHAGEADGLESIRQAVYLCGADRIGHGTRLIDDVSFNGNRIESIGPLASYIRNTRVPIEMCLTSNIGTGATKRYEEHPFNLFYKNDFTVFLCSDNRLMSNTSLTKEMTIATKIFDLQLSDLRKMTIHAMESAFIGKEMKEWMIQELINPQYGCMIE